MEGEREIAGLRCGEVLEHLSEYLDGECDAALRAKMEAHVKDCNVCERFGGRFHSAVQALRRTSDSGEAPDDAAIASIEARIREHSKT